MFLLQVRYKSSERICKKAKRLVLLSGTPALSRPIELYSQVGRWVNN